ncbi:MAG: hypothetical protein IPI23_16315 [Bacteroidetes bacterium]|nr:hypothetical protein [Bacteroidota bacterium]
MTLTTKKRVKPMTLEEFTNEFVSARSQLKSYILRITASIEETEDIVQRCVHKKPRLNSTLFGLKAGEDLGFLQLHQILQRQFTGKEKMA